MKYINDAGYEIVEVYEKNIKHKYGSGHTCGLIVNSICLSPYYQKHRLLEAYLKDDEGRIEDPERLLSSCVGDVRFIGLEDEKIRAARRRKKGQSRRNSLWFLSKTATNTEINSGRKHTFLSSWLSSRIVKNSEPPQLCKGSIKKVTFAEDVEINYFEKVIWYSDYNF